MKKLTLRLRTLTVIHFSAAAGLGHASFPAQSLA